MLTIGTITAQQACSTEMVKFSHYVEKYGFVYSAVSRLLDRSMRFTLHPPLADLFIPALTRLFWEAFSHAVIMREDLSLFTYISTAVYSKVISFIHLSELRRRGENENVKTLIR